MGEHRQHPGFGPGPRQERTGYHHGSLKEALLDAAEALITERGPAGISLSEMARMAGVTPAAVYRHYADLRALIGSVARRGFEDFSIHLRNAQKNAHDPGNGIRGFQGMGNAYLDFAQRRPGAYAAMFSSATGYSDPELEVAGQRAFQTLLDGVAAALAPQNLPADAAFQTALKIWALSHGIATLAQSGRLSPANGCVPQDLLRDGVEAIILGARSPLS